MGTNGPIRSKIVRDEFDGYNDRTSYVTILLILLG